MEDWTPVQYGPRKQLKSKSPKPSQQPEPRVFHLEKKQLGLLLSLASCRSRLWIIIPFASISVSGLCCQALQDGWVTFSQTVCSLLVQGFLPYQAVGTTRGCYDSHGPSQSPCSQVSPKHKTAIDSSVGAISWAKDNNSYKNLGLAYWQAWAHWEILE